MQAQLRLDSVDPERSAEELGGLRGDAIIYIVPDPDPEYLGYHSLHASGTPFGFVFTHVAGDDWTVALSHEVLELLADPGCNLFCMGPHPDPAEGEREVFHWFEVCDAVQEETYEIDGVRVCNFVLPYYFTGGDEMDGRNDFLGTLTAEGRRLRSFSVNPGGYLGFHDADQPDSEQHWFADADARAKFDRKRAVVGPRGFRRADRRGKLHPLAIPPPTTEPTPEPSAGHERAPTRLAPGVETVEGLALRLGDEELFEDLEQEIDRELRERIGSTEFMLRRSDFEPRELQVHGPALACMDLPALWELVHGLRANKPAWLDEAELLLRAKAGHGDSVAAPKGVRASGMGERTCRCDRPDHSSSSSSRRWALEAANVTGAWSLLAAERGVPSARAGEGVVIAHPDTGYTNYLRSRGCVLRGRDFTVRDSDGLDPLAPGFPGHGTRTGSVIVAPHGDRDGHELDPIDGVAPGARLIPFRISSTVVLGGGWNLAEALDAARLRQAQIVSMSVGTLLGSRRLRRAIAAAHDAHLILIAAAGNCVGEWLPSNRVVKPASYEQCIACAALSCEDGLWCGSSDGPEVSVYAPGESVWCYTVEPELRGPVRRRGTSFATAIVAGVAALWIQWHGHDALIERCEVAGVKLGDLYRAVLRGCGEPFGSAGARRLDAAAVLEIDLDQALAAAQAPRPAERGPLDKLAELFPDVARELFEDRLAGVLGLPRAALPELAEAHEGELELVVGFDAEVRAALRGQPPKRRRGARRGDWREHLSATLRARLLADD